MTRANCLQLAQEPADHHKTYRVNLVWEGVGVKKVRRTKAVELQGELSIGKRWEVFYLPTLHSQIKIHIIY
jgi:hypothetical protein